MATWFNRPIMARSYLNDQDVACGLLSPDALHRAADGAHHRLLDRLGIAPPAARHAVEDVPDRVGDEIGNRLALTAPGGQAHDLDDRVTGDLAALVDGDGHRDDAGEGELAPLR